MMKNKGQALVEFIIILPVLLLILLGIVELGNIIYKKYSLESSLDTVVELYKDDKKDDLNKYLSDENKSVSYEYDEHFTKIILKENVEVITPGLVLILHNPYEISVERIIYNE